MIKYGTSGFRDHNTKIINIAEKIGTAMAQLVDYEKQSFGIMITASHNHHNDNGVKIMNMHGNMVSNKIESYLENYVNNLYETNDSNSLPPYSPLIRIFDKDLEYLKRKNISLTIGYDSRESSPRICELIAHGILKCNNNFPIRILPLVTTPELHFVFSKFDAPYLKYIKKVSKHIYYPCIVDCANGIGGKKLKEIKVPSLELINVSWNDHEKLNNNCSSDFVCSERKLPTSDKIIDDDSKLRASLDGDADRIVFYYGNNDSIQLLNGDNIAALIFTYLCETLNPSSVVTLGYVYTGYTNNACVEYIQSLPFHENVILKCVCTATGVKHLHNEAEKYDIGVYFEQNGHGNVLFHKKIPSLEKLETLFHPNIGDGILDLFAVLFILQELEMYAKDWYELYSPYECLLTKHKVENKNIFSCSEDELYLLSPLDFQKFINDKIIEEDNYIRAFARPSGTENTLRLYVEGYNKEDVKRVQEKISGFITNNYE